MTTDMTIDMTTDMTADIGSEELAGIGADHSDEPARLALVASAEPGVVFSSLAAGCVPDLCDTCTIDIVDGLHASYRIARPSRGTTGGGLLRLATRAGEQAEHRLEVAFGRPGSATAYEDEHWRAPMYDGFSGMATFLWHRRTPSHSDRVVAALLVDHAIQTVMWQRSESAFEAAAADAAHIRLALQNSRRIGTAVGVLMSLHKITEDQALERLKRVSQHCNRKLRDVARDVVDTGCLEAG